MELELQGLLDILDLWGNLAKLDGVQDHREILEILACLGSLGSNVELGGQMGNQEREGKLGHQEYQDQGGLLDRQGQWDHWDREGRGDLAGRLVSLGPQDLQEPRVGIGMDTLDHLENQGRLVGPGRLMDALGLQDTQVLQAGLGSLDPLGQLDLGDLQAQVDLGVLEVRGVKQGNQAGMGQEMDHRDPRVTEARGVQMVLRVQMAAVGRLGQQEAPAHEVLLVQLAQLGDQVSLGYQVGRVARAPRELLGEATNKHHLQCKEYLHSRL